jgi:hypothetical protein
VPPAPARCCSLLPAPALSRPVSSRLCGLWGATFCALCALCSGVCVWCGAPCALRLRLQRTAHPAPAPAPCACAPCAPCAPCSLFHTISISISNYRPLNLKPIWMVFAVWVWPRAGRAAPGSKKSGLPPQRTKQTKDRDQRSTAASGTAADTGLAPGPAAGYRYLAPASADHQVLSRACGPVITTLDLAAKGHQRIRCCAQYALPAQWFANAIAGQRLHPPTYTVGS